MIADAVDAVADALAATGLRVALRAGDITPPVVFVQIGGVESAGGTLAAQPLATLWLHYIPVRGVENVTGDADALDSIFAALADLAWTDTTASRSSVTIGNDTWPAYRVDVGIVGQPAL